MILEFYSYEFMQKQQNVLIQLYAICGLVKITCFVFDKTLEEDVISKSSMFAWYFNGGDWEEVTHQNPCKGKILFLL